VEERVTGSEHEPALECDQLGLLAREDLFHDQPGDGGMPMTEDASNLAFAEDVVPNVPYPWKASARTHVERATAADARGSLLDNCHSERSEESQSSRKRALRGDLAFPSDIQNGGVDRMSDMSSIRHIVLCRDAPSRNGPE
jgi:hypothetical protein